MKTYIQSNVLKGPFYNLNRILKNETHKNILLSILDSCLKKDLSVAKAIDDFADYTTRNLFGEKAARILLKEHTELLAALTGYGGTENRYRTILNKIIKRNLIYDPQTGRNNLNNLSSFLINDINIWLNAVVKKEKFQPNNLFVKDVLYLAVRAVMEVIALRWIAYGNLVDAVSNKIFRTQTKSYEQFREIIKNGIEGAIVFRGLTFLASPPIHIKIYNLNPNHHLIDAMNRLKKGYSMRGASWSTDWEIVRSKFAHLPREFKSESFENYLKKLKYGKPGVKYEVNCDKVKDIKKIIKHGIDNADKIRMDVHFILSFPLINGYSKKFVKTPVQLLVNIGTKYKYEKEIGMIPKNFNITDSAIDGRITFMKWSLSPYSL